MTGPKEVSTLLSPPDSDVVYGLRAIAAFCGMTTGQAQPFVDLGIIPTFRLPEAKSYAPVRRLSVRRGTGTKPNGATDIQSTPRKNSESESRSAN